MHHGSNRSVNALTMFQLFGLWCLNPTSGAFLRLDHGFLDLFVLYEEGKE